MSYHVDEIRKQFPILDEKINGKPLIYLDNAATTQKPLPVIEKINYMYRSCNANVHRGVHYLSNKATDEMEAARRKVQQFVNAGSEAEIVFTRGTTEAVNLVAACFSEAFLGEGDEIIVSEMEHHSNLVPWQMACQKKNASLVMLPFDDSGELCTEQLSSLMNSRTRLIALTHVSNALGSINPVKAIIEAAHSRNIAVLIDGAQAVQHLPVDVRDLNCDFYVFSGHKMYGPTGIGVLYGKREWLDKLPPYQGGGEMISRVSFQKSEYNELPFKFEAGTPDYVGIVALGAAIDFLNQVGIKHIAQHEEELLHYTMQLLEPLDTLRFIGTARQKCSVISFLAGKSHPYDVGVLLDQLGIAVRTGTHCAETVMQHFAIPGTARISFGLYNTADEVETLARGLVRVVKML